jgi:hypothetical protein
LGRDTYHEQSSFQPVGLPVSEEVAHHDDGQHKQSNHEDFEVEIQGLADGPSDENHEWGVEQGSLDGGAKAVVEGYVNDSVPCLVDGGEMLGGFFNEREKDLICGISNQDFIQM